MPETTRPLRVDGLVATPLELSLADLRALPRRELTATLQCAGNRRVDLLRVRDIPGEAPWGPGRDRHRDAGRVPRWPTCSPPPGSTPPRATSG